MRIVFLGSADFGIPALGMLREKHTVAGVVSTPPRQKGRRLKTIPSAIMEFVSEEMGGVPCLTPGTLNDPQFMEQLKGFKADCFVVVAFKLLPKAIFTIPPLGTVNIHASLLPHYRGPAPIHRAIEAGERKTGVTVFRIDEGIDTGEILRQEMVDIGANETTPELYERLSILGAQCLDETLAQMESQTLKPVFQDASSGSKAPKLHKEEALIDWNLPAETLFNRVRAFKPFPGTFTMYNKKRLGIEWATVPQVERHTGVKAGTVTAVGGDFFDVQTGNGVLRIHSVKPEGRSGMAVRDFLNGTRLREGLYLFE